MQCFVYGLGLNIALRLHKVGTHVKILPMKLVVI
jgi:hypothetical protein